MLSVILLSIGMCIDALGIGISFGVRRIKLGKWPCLVISLLGFGIISLAVLSGSILQMYMPESTGSLILMAMGVWILVQSRRDAATTDNTPVRILREPAEGDMDGSGDIDIKEAVFLGLALSLDSIGICVGAGGSLHLACVLPAAAMVIQMIFLITGIRLGAKIGSRFDPKLCTICSGMIIILLGLINLTEHL